LNQIKIWEPNLKENIPPTAKAKEERL